MPEWTLITDPVGHAQLADSLASSLASVSAASAGHGRVGSVGDWSRNVLRDATSAPAVTYEVARIRNAQAQGPARSGNNGIHALDARRTEAGAQFARHRALRARYLGQDAHRCFRAEPQAADTYVG